MLVSQGLTENRDLRMVFQYLFGDYGSMPDEASFSILGLIHRHYWRGAYYPRGGASEIPYHITKEIQKAGGAVLVRAKVTSVILDSSQTRAVGVRVEKGSSTVDILAPLVVSGAGVSQP
jgi:all-trans-retinol 13,14-reductase